jgi:hypothetical protein
MCLSMTLFHIGETVGNSTGSMLQTLTKTDTTDLKYCGEVPERYTTIQASLDRTVDCKVCPNENCETVEQVSANTPITLTCEGQTVPDYCLSFCTRKNGEVFLDDP